MTTWSFSLMETTPTPAQGEYGMPGSRKNLILRNDFF